MLIQPSNKIYTPILKYVTNQLNIKYSRTIYDQERGWVEKTHINPRDFISSKTCINTHNNGPQIQV